VVALQGDDQGHAHHGAGRDVGRLEVPAVPGAGLLPRHTEAVHGHREAVAVEASGDFGVTEEDEAQQGQDVVEGGGEAAVEGLHRLDPPFGRERLIPVDDGSGGHQGIDRGAQGFDDGLDEQLVLAVEVSVDDALADPGALGDDPDRGAGGVAVLDERPARRIEDRGLPGCGGQPSPDRWVAVLRCRRAHGQDSNHRSGGQGTLTHLDPACGTGAGVSLARLKAVPLYLPRGGPLVSEREVSGWARAWP